MASIGPESPRQKMINLMYLVLMALLALNVSSDVLNGFSLVDESLNRSTANSTTQNKSLYKDMADFLAKNPEKVQEWFNKAQYVRKMSDSLYQYVDELKFKIVKAADGDEANVRDVKNKEDLEAANFVMLAPGTGQGKRLYNAINKYRKAILTMVVDSTQKQIINNNLSTKVPRRATTIGKNWQEYIFENTPVAAAVTLLTKLQNDIRYAEGEVLHTLVKNIDVRDIRVNEVNAYVIPNAQTIVRGGKFSAQVILAAVDSTQKPSVYIGNRLLPAGRNGFYETICNSTGNFNLTGYLELNRGNGDILRRNFSQKYTVIDPSATVSATMMNVLYAGYDNPMSVSVPGVPSQNVQMTVTNGNGSIRAVSGGYIVRPSKVGQTNFAVTANVGGRSQLMGNFEYRVRQLPDPMPFIEYEGTAGNPKRYRGGTGFSKALLMGTEGIGAAIDDGLLNVNFRVLNFETIFFDNMGNAVPEVSAGSKFSARQRDVFRKLSRGKRFYISRVKAVGPDGIERLLPTTLEVIVN
ncbi:gliding motility protein GldM [uncultured Bacteroides sp.]|uniref:type IX secretion system motor protein PorM/GldM n=1 Tax=uncultured Bacteroides sp. TaxID=162156 RepID=UPI002AAC1707|nr:gliding motility protein GldM [uncultured Bacteroides sp.]